jgi:hypothetical protein
MMFFSDDPTDATSATSEAQRSTAATPKSVRQQPVNQHIDLRMFSLCIYSLLYLSFRLAFDQLNFCLSY